MWNTLSVSNYQFESLFKVVEHLIFLSIYFISQRKKEENWKWILQDEKRRKTNNYNEQFLGIQWKRMNKWHYDRVSFVIVISILKQKKKKLNTSIEWSFSCIDRSPSSFIAKQWNQSILMILSKLIDYPSNFATNYFSL